MTKCCIVCEGTFNLTHRELKSVHPDLSVYCSVSCLMKYLRSRKGEAFGFFPVPKPSWMRGFIGKRSTYENVFERFLGLQSIAVAYEPFAIRLPDGKRYLPDFALPNYGVVIEVKGIPLGKKNRDKLNQVIEVVPEESFVLVPGYLIKQMKNRLRQYDKLK